MILPKRKYASLTVKTEELEPSITQEQIEPMTGMGIHQSESFFLALLISLNVSDFTVSGIFLYMYINKVQ